MVRTKQKRRELLLVLGITLLTCYVLILLSDRFRVRIDLTEDKRYTISESSRQILHDLEAPVYIEVYLAGELPAGFKRFQKSIKETLEEFETYAGRELTFSFIDPSKAPSRRARDETYRNLIRRGIQPTNLFDTKDGQRTEKLIFPGAVVVYGGAEKTVQLLRGNKGDGPQEQLNQSIEDLEYQFADAISALSAPALPKLALLRGHGELDSLQVASFRGLLSGRFRLSTVDLRFVDQLEGYEMALLLKPAEKFSEQDKFKLDQFVMNGGKLIACVDPLAVNLEEAEGEGTISVPRELNLTDFFFNYGLRINNELIQDINSGVTPVVVGTMGDQPQIQLLPWPFFPQINRYADHPITKNMDAVLMKFVSSVDTVKAEGVKKTPLMFTSEYTRVSGAPVNVSFNQIRQLQPENFREDSEPVGYLLEGNFESLYNQRLLPVGTNQGIFRERSITPSKILVIPDGDFLRNELDNETGAPLELGYDQYTRRKYANDDFIMNAITYMLDEDGLIQSRSKEIEIRPLDKIKIGQEALYWQIVNIALPLFLLAGLGGLRWFLRKNYYRKQG